MKKERFTSETLRELLRKAGYKATPARMAILEFLNTLQKPVSVPEIIQKLGQNIDGVTAYRTLDALKKSGIVRQIDFHHDHAYYELASLGEHHHAICTNCKRVEDI